MPSKIQYYDFESEDEYIEQTPREARFDVNTIRLLCVEAFQKHQAYGMLFEEYQRKRSQFMDSDDSERKRLSFYFPKFPARVSSDLAIINNTSHHRFLILMIELGLITFHVDYHDEYKIVKDGRPSIFNHLTTTSNHHLYLQIEKQTIVLNSGTGYKQGGSKHFVPSVPEWLYNAAMDAAVYLNMSISDFIYLCWCIGVQNSLPEDMVPKIVGDHTLEVCYTFKMELQEYSDRILNILEKMNVSSV